MTVDVRLERLDHLAAKFKLKCDIHEAWSRGKEDMLQAQDFKKCRLSDLKVMTKARVCASLPGRLQVIGPHCSPR